MFTQKNPIGLFLLLSTFTALVGAFVHPLMSLFVVEELNNPPAYFGLYTIAVTISGLLISQWFGAKADNGSSTLLMYLQAILGIALGLFIYALLSQTDTHSFWLMLLVGVCFIALGSAAIPQMLTLARQWSNSVGHIDIIEFNTRLRAAISIAWVIGPAIGFSIVAYTSFTVAFYLAAAIALSTALFAYRLVPRVKTVKKALTAEDKQSAPLSFWLLAAAIASGSAANVLYSSALPLYTINELGFSPSLPGFFIATVALTEIPIILLSSRLARLFDQAKIMMIAFVVAMIFYTGIYFSTDVWQFFALQLVNAVYYGLFAGLSLSFLQEQLPKRVGFTSALCSNAIKVGMMTGATLMGVIAQFSSFRHANIGAFLAALIGFLCLLSFKYFKKKEQVNGGAERVI